MLKLYHLPLSFNSRRVWIALLEKGLDFQLIPLSLDGDQLKPEFLELNPFHHVPVLVDDDFTVIESLAILDYLEAKYPHPPLLPKEPRSLAIVKMIELITANELVPHLFPLIHQKMGIRNIDSSIIESSLLKIEQVLIYFDNILGDNIYFIGEEFTYADLVAGTSVTILPGLGISLKKYSQLSRHCKTLSERESWQKTKPTEADISAYQIAMKKVFAPQEPKA